MPTRKETAEYILDQLGRLGDARARKMFGEYALYYRDKVVALICDDDLFVKVTGPGKDMALGFYTEKAAYPGAKPSMKIDSDKLEDSDWFCRLIVATYNSLAAKNNKK